LKGYKFPIKPYAVPQNIFAEINSARVAAINAALKSGELSFQMPPSSTPEAIITPTRNPFSPAGEAAAKPVRTAKLTVLSITQNEALARVQLEEMLQQGYQLPTGEPVTMDNIRFYQLPDNWTKEDIEREARGMNAVLLNVDGLALQADIMGILKVLGIPAAEVRENNWRDALNSV